VNGASGLLHLASRATDQLLDRGDDPVGGGVVQQTAKAGSTSTLAPGTARPGSSSK
jgi:hypothetical protein